MPGTACIVMNHGELIYIFTTFRSIGHVELERAKKAAISIISNALESKATSSEDIGRQFLTYGHRS